jgi:ERCC4-type nuclease
MEIPIKIMADPREGQSEVVHCLQSLESVSVQFAELVVGDYQTKGFVFKRIPLADFQNSIIDGRYTNQISALARSARRGVLIIEGTTAQVASIREHRNALQGALVTAGLILGIPILRAKDCMETARVMVYTARHQRLANDHFYSRTNDGPEPGGKRLP